MKKTLFFFALVFSFGMYAQSHSKRFHTKSFLVKNDSVKIDTVSISPLYFNVLTPEKKKIDTSYYYIDFSKALLVFTKNPKPNKVIVEYFSYPSFLTKKYFKIDEKIIVPKATNQSQLYALTSNQKKIPYKPFDGLNTTGTIARGVTVGNNQNAVVNATLDLQISGKISENVMLKASIVDTNIPIQENGNTFKLNEFERVFIELSSKKWKINAGDIYLNNNETSYLRFNKKVAGLNLNATISNKKSEITVNTSGAVVRGKYKKINFNGQEGNQGPYKLTDLTNNTYVLILAGTEQIYVNGQLLKRGENNDYIIDYNTGEITFSTTFPITADMRITAEYQFTDRVYTRFITYNSINYKTNNNKLQLSGYFYNENDLKNQPLDQILTDEQKLILSNAGNDTSLMVTPSAYEDVFSENKILYKKTLIGTTEVFEYSTNENDVLYHVSFSYVGEHMGNYALKEVIAVGKVYEFVGENAGDYNPVIQLIAPNKLQLAVFKASYKPINKTTINTEIAFSNNDLNLFSEIDDRFNEGMAAKLNWSQLFFQKKWSLKSNFLLDYIDTHFKSIERIQSVEFDRDWNITANEREGNQRLIRSNMTLSNAKSGHVNYTFESLSFGNNFEGIRHLLTGDLTHKNISVNVNSSLLNSESTIEKSSFLRNYIQSKLNLSKSWVEFDLNAENNERTLLTTNTLSNLSHKYNEYKFLIGIGDSSNVYTSAGVIYRTTDSVQNGKLSQVNKAKTFFVKSSLIKNKYATLTSYVNYRTVKNTNYENEESLNSKIVYKQQLFHQFLTLNTTYQTLSGTLPQQDFAYIETEPGQGFYTWIDYNNNGVKELNEFEIAQFPDQATYLRIFLPTINYIATHQNKFSQTFIVNPQQWNTKKGFKKFVSHFYNQSFILVDNKKQKTGNQFNFNPFDIGNDKLLALNFNINNSLYFNKGKKHFSTTYLFIKSQNKNTSTIDDLENKVSMHQIKFEHKLGDFWLLNFNIGTSKNSTNSLNYINRNYKLENYQVYPKLSYYYNENAYFSLFYEFKNKENLIGLFETLKLQKIGVEINYSNQKRRRLKASLNLFNNRFFGNVNSPVAYQMLEGLQNGKNYTWSFLFQQQINSFLHLDINYLGRKSETSKTIHTGTIQLKALF
ncbi:hypothetical protein [Lutibacter sp.]